MITTDFLVIGSGIAGLGFAVEAARHGKVCLVTKGEVNESNTELAEGGIASVLSGKDSFALHVKDTLEAGDGLCNERAVRLMVRDAPKEIKRLVGYGADFDKDDGRFSLGIEGGHSRKRIVHRGDETGKEIEESLVRKARESGNIGIFENCMAFELLVEDGRCIGARVLDTGKGKVVDFFSKTVLLATGGLSSLFRNSSNPDIATGDGVAMGYRAGCEVVDMEFVQFHPTAFRRKGKPFFVISEAVRGEGAKLLNSRGKRFVDEMGTRDEVTRAIWKEMENGQVHLDVSHKRAEFLKKRFPSIYRTCMEYGVDITKEKIPVEPAAHYSCGGIRTDLLGWTGVEGLFAFGEVACTGVHGANRLASNSLLESLVFSRKALEAALKWSEGKGIVNKKTEPVKVSETGAGNLKERVRGTMWKNVGVIRDAESLSRAANELEKIGNEYRKLVSRGISRDLLEAGNMILVSGLIVKAALMREESRGVHFRKDFSKKRKGTPDKIRRKIPKIIP